MLYESGHFLHSRPPEQDASWSQTELEKAMLESMEMQKKMHYGRALRNEDLEQKGFYYESQDPGSDTCGLNALNNLCQRPLFATGELQKAEAQHAQAQDGGSFAQSPSLSEMPTGFFDVEALKIAASARDLQIVDVEPVPDHLRSRCFAFAQAAAAHGDGAWLLGFLVYDRQPGQMHYYSLRRDERMRGSWLKLDSLLPAHGAECKNRQLQEEDLWTIYTDSKPQFQSWSLRWYPVVYRPLAAREVCKAMESQGYKLSRERAAALLAESGWLVSEAIAQLLQHAPQAALRELLIRFARPSETEMRVLLEDSGWDLSAAQPAIDKVLKHRIALASQVDAGERTKQALSLCDWEPKKAAALLALQLQLGAPASRLPELQEALSATGGDADRAEAVLKLLQLQGSADMKIAARLLEQTGSWSIQAAQRVLTVRQRFPRVSVPVAMKVLRRNDEDPHAACEMLTEYRKRVKRVVAEQADSEDIMPGEEAAIAETALNATDWDPNSSFLAARNLSHAVRSTRKLARTRVQDHFPIDSVLTALTAGDMKPKVALALLLGEQAPTKPSRQAPRALQLPDQNTKALLAAHPSSPAGEPADDDYCCVM